MSGHCKLCLSLKLLSLQVLTFYIASPFLGTMFSFKWSFNNPRINISGHCAEKDHEPPRGLQLILGTKSTPHLVDTLVMANLGYWQMKVSPGVWYLQLAPGRSSELYVMKEDGQGSSSNTTLSKRITIDDLRGKLVHLEVVKRKGKEHEKLLVSSDNDEGYSTEKVSRGFVFDEFLVYLVHFFSLF